MDDYSEIIASFGKVLIEQWESAYHGSIYACVKDYETGKYGYIVQSFGTCSYCDALQAVGPEETRREMKESIKWFDALEDLRALVKAEVDEEYSDPELAVFYKKLLELDFKTV
jgi:hypothetical protein